MLWKPPITQRGYHLRTERLEYYGLSRASRTRWRIWLRHFATSRKVACSIPDGVIGIFYWLNPSGPNMAVGSTQPLTEMSARNISWQLKWPFLITFVCRLYWNLWASEPLEACTRIALPCLAEGSQNGDGNDDDDDDNDDDEIKKGMIGKCISMQQLPYVTRILITKTERKRPLHMSEDDIECTPNLLNWIHVTQNKVNLPFLVVTFNTYRTNVENRVSS